MNLMGIAILAVFLVFAANGWRKGLVRKLGGVVALIISAALVSAILPSVTRLIKTQTPIYEMIVSQCENLVGTKTAETALSRLTGSESGAIDREQIKALMDQYGLDSSSLDSMSDSQVRELVNQYFQDAQSQVAENAKGALDGLTRIEQTKLIQSLPVPDFMQKMLLNYNNSEGYQTLGATDFASYLIRFIANVILNIIAFLVTLLAVHLILWGILTALDLFARLPFLYTINRFGGLVIGAVQGLFAVWMIFLLISLFSGTAVGMGMLEQINASPLLAPMYESNLFLKIVTGAIGNMM